MQGLKRKIVYVSLFEFFAVGLTTTTLMTLAGSDGGHSVVAAIASSTIAVIWNFIFNTLFEAWEARQSVKGRSVARRICHAVGFEGGLVAFLVPMFAWWLGISLWEAFIVDLWSVVFFLIYTFLFSLAFDRIFGLPASATAATPASASPPATAKTA